jgi:signal transduction histidine kinase
MTVRLRLTLAYVALFFLLGAALLTVAYVTVRHHFQTDSVLRLDAGPDPPPESGAARRPLAESAIPAAVRAIAEARNREALHGVLTAFAVALAAFTVLSVLAGRMLAARALRPVAALTDRLRAEVDARERFVGNAAHQLLTPLSVMAAELEELTAVCAGRDGEAMVANARRACDRSTAAVRGLLDLALGQAGTRACESVDLAQLVCGELAQRRFVGELRGELEPAVLTGDRALLQECVATLVANALEHAHPRDEWLLIDTGKRDGAVYLRIENPGVHIPADAVPRLTEPFFRQAGRATGGGPGLGLAIADAVVAAHEGRLAMEARDAGGLAVEVSLPVWTCVPTGVARSFTDGTSAGI